MSETWVSSPVLRQTNNQMNKKLMEFIYFSAWISSSGGSLTKLPRMAPSGWSKYGLSGRPECRSQELCEGRELQCGVRPQLRLSPLEIAGLATTPAPCIPGIYL